MNAPNLKSAASAAEAPQASLMPLLMLALPLAKTLVQKMSWRTAGFGLVALAAGYLVHSLADDRRRPRPPPQSGKTAPEDLARWEDEGGMVATRTAAAPSPKANGHAGDSGKSSL